MTRALPLAAGTAAAALQFAGALKSLPLLAALPFDLTLVAGLALAGLLMPLAAARDWRVAPAAALPLGAAALLLLWLVLAGAWSPSRQVLSEKLPALVLLGPAMLGAGLLVGADPPTLRRFAGAVVAIGLGVGGGIAWGLAAGEVVLGGAVGAAPGLVRVQYQLAGLAMACAGGLAAVRLTEARGAGRAAWSLVLAALGLAALIPGGRAALLAFGLGVGLAPALGFWLRGRPAAAMGWLLGVVATVAAAVLALLAMPGVSAGFETLDRIFGDPASATPARRILWDSALAWGGAAAPLGLGTGGFTQVAGFGDDRALHPHNHALEALAEGGLPGLALWLLAFGGGAALVLVRAGAVAPGRAARIAALTLPLAVTAMVSTDLGNRMVWFALGLGLSLAVEARPRGGDV